MNDTYSYESGADQVQRLIHRKNGEVIASVGADSPKEDLEMVLKGWVLSPNLRKTVEGWLKTQKSPKAVKAASGATKAKRASTRGGPVSVSKIE